MCRCGHKVMWTFYGPFFAATSLSRPGLRTAAMSALCRLLLVSADEPSRLSKSEHHSRGVPLQDASAVACRFARSHHVLNQLVLSANPVRDERSLLVLKPPEKLAAGVWRSVV